MTFELREFGTRWQVQLENGQHNQPSNNIATSFYGEKFATEASMPLLSTGIIGEDPTSQEHLIHPNLSDQRFIIAVDFGTTFSSISFIAVSNDGETENVPNLHNYINRIRSISNFPDEPYTYTRLQEVPSEILYFKKSNLNINHTKARDKDGDIDMSNEIDDDSDDEGDRDAFWGYEVQRKLDSQTSSRSQNQKISRFKLLLDKSEKTQGVRDNLDPHWKELKQRKIIETKEDVIADYLSYLFSHAKNALEKDHAFSSTCPVEFVLCVPPIWSPEASRIMQVNMKRAIDKSGLGRSNSENVDNLFIVSEPEAAASYVLSIEGAVMPEETFVLIDAGGGTVDAITYTVDQTYPLRLKAEGVEPGGDLCGSSYLNEAFQKHLRARLIDETYLETLGLTIEDIIDTLLIQFEYQLKRSFDVKLPHIRTQLLRVNGLRANSDLTKRFKNHAIKIESADLKEIFIPFLKRISVLLMEQLDRAKGKGLNVKKVILIGGFANSPSLRSYLDHELRSTWSLRGNAIKLIVRAADIAVSYGAVLRALNKKDGPERRSRSSYGFLCSEHYQPEIYPAHAEVRSMTDPLDGIKYVKYTICWLIQKGDIIPAEKEYSMTVFYIFDANEERFECHEELWVSDEEMESHYRFKHTKNSGATRIGTIETDMTFLREQQLIEPIEPGEGDKFRKHYSIAYELVMVVNDRNMRWEARYPAGGQVQGGGQVSIASAFMPGTK